MEPVSITAGVTALCDRLIQLASIKSSKQTSIFQNIIQATQTEFEKVHAQYVESFKNYRSLIQDARLPLTTEHPVFETLEQDMLYTLGARGTLWVALEATDNKKARPYLALVHAYLKSSINFFLESETVERHGYAWGINMPRLTLIDRLHVIFKFGRSDKEKRKDALSAVNAALVDLQNRYLAVIREYTDAKNALLKLNR
jgi:hypothetical protein